MPRTTRFEHRIFAMDWESPAFVVPGRLPPRDRRQTTVTTVPGSGAPHHNGGVTVRRRRRGRPRLATFLIDLSPDDMQARLGDALTVYVDAMRYPRGTEGQRAPMWLEHSRRTGWRAVAAVEVDATVDARLDGVPAGLPTDRQLAAARLLGVAYGYSGAPDQWWQQQVLRGLHHFGWPNTEIKALISDYFELTELHIHPDAQGRGLGEALVRRLLSERPEANVLLSTPEINGEPNRAWRLYRRLGFADVIRGYHFSGDPRAFAILGRALPL